MTDLRLHPNYSHAHQRTAPPTTLTALTASEAYEKLRPYLAMKLCSDNPASWPEDRCGRDLFHKNGQHHSVRWLPKINSYWRRLNYDEFCVWYGIQI